MPSKSPAQHKLMQIAAHTPGGYGGVPQKAGKEFSAADKAAGGADQHPHKNLGGYLHPKKARPGLINRKT
jgi:hypothetical protein